MLSFGVPLQDVFPEREIHPSIKNCLVQAHEIISKKSLTVEDVLRCQGTIQQRLVLKERLVKCRDISKLQIEPGALLWVVRHFIGLLPLPLLYEMDWIETAKLCRLAFTANACEPKKDLIRRITNQLVVLPVHNFLLTATLFNFFRMLAVLPTGEPRVNKMAAFALAKYFASSLFVKPFSPGCVKKVDKQFYSLALFLIVKWPAIRNICAKSTNYRFEPTIEEIYSGFNKSEPLSPFPYYLYKKRADATSQTLNCFDVTEEVSEVEIRVVPPSYDTCEFLQDVGCQTDFEEFKNVSSNCKFQISVPVPERLDVKPSRVVFKKENCYCRYGSHDIPGVEKNPQDSELLSNETVEDWLSDGTTSEGSETLRYDYDQVEPFDPVKKLDPTDLLKVRASKIGWTYTSGSKDSQNFDPPPVLVENIGWDVQNTSDLENICQSLNKELKERFNKNQSESNLSTKETPNTCLSEQEKIVESSIDLSPGDNSEKKKNRTSISKIKSGLDFLNIFNSKKSNTRRSSSFERVESKIRYEKIGSVNSVLL